MHIFLIGIFYPKTFTSVLSSECCTALKNNTQRKAHRMFRDVSTLSPCGADHGTLCLKYLLVIGVGVEATPWQHDCWAMAFQEMDKDHMQNCPSRTVFLPLVGSVFTASISLPSSIFTIHTLQMFNF